MLHSGQSGMHDIIYVLPQFILSLPYKMCECVDGFCLQDYTQMGTENRKPNKMAIMHLCVVLSEKHLHFSNHN